MKFSSTVVTLAILSLAGQTIAVGAVVGAVARGAVSIGAKEAAKHAAKEIAKEGAKEGAQSAQNHEQKKKHHRDLIERGGDTTAAAAAAYKNCLAAVHGKHIKHTNEGGAILFHDVPQPCKDDTVQKYQKLSPAVFAKEGKVEVVGNNLKVTGAATNDLVAALENA